MKHATWLMKWKLCAGAVLALGVMLVSLPALHAQTTASISGVITDSSGAVVPGAKVTAINQATNDKTVTSTGGAGNFTFPIMLPGSYTIKVELKGFETSEQTGITVDAGSRVAIPTMSLKVGNSTQTVTVQATSQILRTENGQLGAVLDTKDIQNMALVTQQVLDLVRTLPGVTDNPNGLGNGLSVTDLDSDVEEGPLNNGVTSNGAAENGGTTALLDGVNINDPGCNCNTIAAELPDMTQEVSYQSSNFGADVPHGPVVVSTISKAGTDQYHGEGYFYARNDALNSNDWVDNNQGKKKGDAHYYYPGGNVGGPIPYTHKKLLGWFGYEKYIQNTGNAFNLESHVPTADMMSGNFTNTAANSVLCPNGITSGNDGTYCNDLTGTDLPDGTTIGVTPGVPAGHIPAQFLSSAAAADAKALASIWPVANATPSAANGYSDFYEPVPGVNDEYVWRARVDYNLSEKTKFYVSYQYGKGSQVADGTGAHIYWTPGNSIPFPGGAMTSNELTKDLAGHFLHTFSDTLTNELVGSFGYANNPVSVNPKSVLRATNGYSGGSTFNTGDPWMPSYNSPGAYNGAQAESFPDFSQQDIFGGKSGNYTLLKEAPSIFDNLVKVWGSHTVKAGLFYEMVDNNQGGFNTTNGSLSFGTGTGHNAVTNTLVGSPNNSLATFIIGSASNFNQNNINPAQDLAYKTIAGYVDDSWKVNSRFSVEYGVRLEHMGRLYDRGNYGIPAMLPQKIESDFFSGNNTTPGLRWFAIDPGMPKSGISIPLIVLAPRFGLSYDVFGT